MKRGRVDPQEIDLILVSHLHGDHFGGLPFFILDAQFSGRTRPLTIAGPPGLQARVRKAMETLFPGSSKTQQRFPIAFRELPREMPTDLDGVSVVGYEVVHASGAPAYAYRVGVEDKVIAYSGDTEWVESLIKVARGADVFICEAYFFDKKVKYHLDYGTLAEHRAELECARLILTHMSEELLGRLAGVDAEAAHDGLELTL